MIVIVGQGNPEAEYVENRHNLGFMILDQIADDYKFGKWKRKFRSQSSEGTIAIQGISTKILLLKPETYYNDSGHATLEAAHFYKIEPANIIVFHDEIDLAPGRVRVKCGGGHAGNRGVKSIINHLGDNFRRVRLGIGHPGDKSKVMSYVLSDFKKSERNWVVALKSACSQALPFLLEGRDDRFQSEVLRLAPAPKSDHKQRKTEINQSDKRPPANSH